MKGEDFTASVGKLAASNESMAASYQSMNRIIKSRAEVNRRLVERRTTEMSESYGPITEMMRLEKLHSRGDLIHPASLDLNKANWKVSSSEDLVQNNFLKFSQRTAEGASRSKLQQVSTP